MREITRAFPSHSGTLRKSLELRPADGRMNGPSIGNRPEPAVGARHDPFAAHHPGEATKTLRHELRCSTKLVAVSITPGTKTLSSGMVTPQSLHS
jgi:hypothetical protein